MFEEKTFCPICNCEFVSEERKHRHMEEKHDNLIGADVELMEKTTDKELLNE
jgi:hypothetical protein